MSIKNALNVRRKTLYLAVAAALPLLMAGGQAYAACTSTNGVVNCSGTFAGGSTGGAIMVVPSNYTAVSTDSTGNTAPLSSTIVGYSNANDYSISSIGSMNVSVPKFSTLNIGAGSTSPTIGTAPDGTTTVITGLKAVPGFVDVFNGGTAPTTGISVTQQLINQAGAKPLVNYEGVDIQQAGTVNNFGTITNTTVGSASSPIAGNTFLVTNGPKVYTEGGADNLPYRTIGVWLNGSGTKLNNYGVITSGVNDSAITNSAPGVTGANATLFTGLVGSSSSNTFAETFNPDGSIASVTLKPNKPTVYAVVATGDNNFYDSVYINNYNKIGAYLYTSSKNNAGTPVAIELKENLLDAHVYNASGAIIEGVTGLAVGASAYNHFTAGSKTTVGGSWATAGTTPDVATSADKNTYTKSSGGAYAIATDNNSDLVTIVNDGTITSYALGTTTYGTAMNLSNARSFVTNNLGGRVNGDISVGNQSNEFTFQNAGILTGNIVITPNAGNGTGTTGSLVPVLQSDGSYVDVATARNVTNTVVIQPVINNGGGGNTVAAIGQITGGIYIASGGAASGGHPFELDVQPLVASGVTVKTGDTYQFSGSNISIATGALATPNKADGSADTTKQIDNTNIHVLSSALVNWAFAGNTTNNVVASLANASTISGLSGSGQVALNALMNSASGSGNGAGSFVQNLVSTDDVRKAGEQLRPEINGANIQAALNVTDKVFGLVDSHLNDTHLAQLTGKSGIATGEQPNGTGVWMQGFGFRGNQDVRKSVDGYSADAYGFAIGADRLVNSNTRLGGAFSYANSSIDDKGVNNGNRTQIDSYQATLYSSMLLDNWYLNGALGLGKHNYDSKRLVLGADVNGSHEAWQYTAKVDAGRPVKVGSATFTPVASLTYSRLNQDAYTESGVGALAIRGSDTNSFRSGLGAKALIPLHEGYVKTALELRTIWNHEFGNTEQNTTANFIGGGSEFTTSGVSTARDGADLGASLRLSGSDNVMKQSLLLSYDAEIKDQYFSQTVLLQARFDF